MFAHEDCLAVASEIAGAIPTQPPRTALIRRSETRKTLIFVHVTLYFFGKDLKFSRAGLAGAHIKVEYMKRN